MPEGAGSFATKCLYPPSCYTFGEGEGVAVPLLAPTCPTPSCPTPYTFGEGEGARRGTALQVGAREGKGKSHGIASKGTCKLTRHVLPLTEGVGHGQEGAQAVPISDWQQDLNEI